ncbi:hypothetical protein Tco_0572074, partial [Tanacetum coccineum]
GSSDKCCFSCLKACSTSGVQWKSLPIQTSQLPIEALDLFDCPWGREL